MSTAELPFQLPCPQCGALLTPPHQVETFACPWCGSTLRTDEGVPLHRLRERVRVTPEQARGAFQAWLAGPETPIRMEKHTDFQVGALQYFPFLRARGGEQDTVVPLAPLPLPEVGGIARVPAQMEPGEPENGQGAPDDDVLLREILAAVSIKGVRDLLLEYRAYYPLRYSFEGGRYNALVDASAGKVYTGRRPARREVMGERAFAAGAVVVLFVLALLVPGLPLKVVALVLGAVGLFFLLKWMVGRYG
jgi:hypothetical protein